MDSGWSLVEARLATATDEDRARLRGHLADGVARPALVVRLDPLVVACSIDDVSVTLLLVEWPEDEAMIRRCRLRVDSRLTAIVHGGVPVLGELVGEGPPAEADEARWRLVRDQADAQVRSAGWVARSANPLEPEAAPAPIDQLARPRQVVVVKESPGPHVRQRSWGWLLFGILLVVLLKLLFTAVRGWQA